MSNTKALILIPIYKPTLESNERIGLQQCFNVLGHYDIVFIGPDNLNPSEPLQDFIDRSSFKGIDPKFFSSIESYNQLLLSSWFYKEFKAYDYMLIHQLDAFVFSDQLNKWMELGYSYVGAPWFKKNENGDYIKEFSGVGNGGFSLRKISHCIEVLESSKKVFSLKSTIRTQKGYGNRNFVWHGFKDHLKAYRFNELHSATEFNEDKILVNAVNRFDFFTIPEPELACDFAFERFPEYLFELNSNKLPFGCHAWWTYDINFYKPIFADIGYTID